MASDIKIIKEQYQGMVDLLTKRPTDMFLSPAVRGYFAWTRAKLSGARVDVFEHPTDAVMPGTVAHNRLQIDDESFKSSRRSARLINPLTALDDIYDNASSRKVLSIGPRTEMEILHLVGVGVLLENIKALDLISNSPWIDMGDMHAMPYQNQTFDITISGWVLGYSRDAQRAVDEMLRVTKSGGLVAIGCSYNPKADDLEYKGDENKIQGRIFRRASEFIDLIGSKLDSIHFQSEPKADEFGPVMLIARIRH